MNILNLTEDIALHEAKRRKNIHVADQPTPIYFDTRLSLVWFSLVVGLR